MYNSKVPMTAARALAPLPRVSSETHEWKLKSVGY